MSNLKDLIVGEVEVDDDEEEESYDEETGEARAKTNGARTTNGLNGHLNDSSEEDEDDDDEEAARLVHSLADLAACGTAD
jgi:transcription elongation factor SPT6